MEHELMGQGGLYAFLSIILHPLEFIPELELEDFSWRMKTRCPIHFSDSILSVMVTVFCCLGERLGDARV